MSGRTESGEEILGAACHWLQGRIDFEIEMVDAGDREDLSDEGSRMVDAQVVLIPLLSRVRLREARERRDARRKSTAEGFLQALRAMAAHTPVARKFEARLFADGFAMAALHLDKGDRSFPAYADVMLRTLGDRIRPYILSCYEAVRHYPEWDSYGMSDEATCAEEFQQIMAEDEAD